MATQARTRTGKQIHDIATWSLEPGRLGPRPVLNGSTAHVDGVLVERFEFERTKKAPKLDHKQKHPGGCSQESSSLDVAEPPSRCRPDFSLQCYPGRMPFFCSGNRWFSLHTCASLKKTLDMTRTTQTTESDRKKKYPFECKRASFSLPSHFSRLFSLFLQLDDVVQHTCGRRPSIRCSVSKLM